MDTLTYVWTEGYMNSHFAIKIFQFDGYQILDMVLHPCAFGTQELHHNTCCDWSIIVLLAKGKIRTIIKLKLIWT